MESPATWVEIVDRLGVPVGVLVAVGVALWRSLTWVAPRIDKALDRHMKTMDTVCESLTAIGDKQAELAGHQGTLARHQEDIRTDLKTLAAVTSAMAGK